MEITLKRDLPNGTGHALAALGDRGGSSVRDSGKGGPSERGTCRWHDSRQRQEQQHHQQEQQQQQQQHHHHHHHHHQQQLQQQHSISSK